MSKFIEQLGRAAIILLLTATQVPAAGSTSIQPPNHPGWQQLLDLKHGATQAYCCKVCKKGKPCGDSCISRSYTCHKGRGCAC